MRPSQLACALPAMLTSYGDRRCAVSMGSTYMRELHKVVVHYQDGTLLRGHTRFFFHEQERVEVTDLEDQVHPVELRHIKAVFFVRDFAGDPDYGERKEFTPDSPVFGDSVRIVFADGEALIGRALGYRPEEKGFFLQPADPKSNNRMIFVPAGALKEIQVGELSW
jgi:hypothetical protein